MKKFEIRSSKLETNSKTKIKETQNLRLEFSSWLLFRISKLLALRIPQGEKRQHPSGAPFFGAIGIVAREIAGGADAGIVDGSNTQVAALPDNLRGEIDLVMRRANAGTELNHQIGRARAEPFRHDSDRVRNNSQLRAFLAGMDQTNCTVNRIDEKNGAAIGNVNPKTDPSLGCDHSITAIETLVAAERRIDDADLFTVNLLRGDKRLLSETMFAANFPMHTVEARERLRFVVRHLEAGNAQCETVNESR